MEVFIETEQKLILIDGENFDELNSLLSEGWKVVSIDSHSINKITSSGRPYSLSRCYVLLEKYHEKKEE